MSTKRSTSSSVSDSVSDSDHGDPPFKTGNSTFFDDPSQKSKFICYQGRTDCYNTEIFTVFIRYFRNYLTLHRSDLAARVEHLDNHYFKLWNVNNV